jgi:hypothetical protein
MDRRQIQREGRYIGFEERLELSFFLRVPSGLEKDTLIAPSLQFGASRNPVTVEGFAAACFAMELITILNRCHRFQGFVYQHARLSPDKRSIEVSVRPRRGSAAICSPCHLPAPGYDQLAERRFEFIPALLRR